MQRSGLIPNVFIAVWSVLVSVTWLLPNHIPPWASFHGDAGMAIVGLLGALAALKIGKLKFAWHGMPTVVLVLVCVPWIQYATGMLPFASQAWLSSSYLFGFLLALLFAAQWEQDSSLQLMDALFGAIAIAAILSVGLVLGFWLDTMEATIDNLWTMGYSGGRHYANVGQPNLLATLLLWGVIAILWAYIRKAIGAMVAICAVIFLILGLALTQSRMAYLASSLVLLEIWMFRKVWNNRRLPWIATALTVIFLSSPYILSFIDALVNIGIQSDSYVRGVQKDELRLRAWSVFCNAALIRPWFGYGWKEVVQAQIEVARSFPSLGGMFGHSHNLALDLILWTGIPAGIAIFAYLIRWLWGTAKRISTQEDAVIYLPLLALGAHSMLEYPYQYLYFLVPAGIFIGVLNARLHPNAIFHTPKWVFALMWIAGALVASLLIRDYLKIQTSFTILRFERAGLTYPDTTATKIPEVRLLTQFKEWFEMVDRPLSTSMTDSELAQQEKVTRAYPSPSALYQLALAYAKNGQPSKAQDWLALICKLSDESECASIQRAWQRGAKGDPKLAQVAWPTE